ncbi:MAG: hypothetical protein KJS97_09500 [Alphaproteobacteria bacterium]|nr:hypothetical protein [Alphaproteobacteria bacterium]
MTDILIRNVDEATKDLLRRRAERRGKSLEADLRDTLEKLPREDAESPTDTRPPPRDRFGPSQRVTSG